MTDRAPIPVEEFEDALDRLDRGEFARFVGRLEAAAGAGDVDIEPPIVTVGDGDDRERILVAPEGPDADATAGTTGPKPDAVVIGPGGSPTTDAGASVRTMADLRQQLLYAVSPATAESIAEEWLGAPARSTSYAPEPTPTAATGGDAAEPGADSGASDETPPSASGVAVGGAPSGVLSAPNGGVGSGTPGGPDGAPTHAGQEPPDDRSGTAARSGTGIVVVGVLVAMILAVSGGVVYAAEVSADGDAGAFAAPVTVEAGGLADAEISQRPQDQVDGSDAEAAGTTTPMPGEGDVSGGHPLLDDTESNRNVRPVPTCERSFLHVVQIQMNALKYNNNSTDDGIRTVRRFSSLRNRRTFQNFEEFVRIITSPTYSPMMSYDSVQYTPIQSSDDYAQVQVITREDGNVTGRYYFRLGKVGHGQYEGCWMTDAVVSIPETNDFSGKVGAQSTGTNETS